MTKKTMATIGVWILAAASAVVLGSTFTEPRAAAAPAPVATMARTAPTSAPEAAEKAPETLPTVEIVVARPRPAKAQSKPAPCNDGETRVVGALRAGPGGATGVRTVTLRCR